MLLDFVVLQPGTLLERERYDDVELDSVPEFNSLIHLGEKTYKVRSYMGPARPPKLITLSENTFNSNFY
jgi:hypothetical protein